MQLSYYIHNNPLRAGIVERLIDYRWSRYPAYAYNRRHPMWLEKDLIRSQIQGENKHRQYRENRKSILIKIDEFGKIFATDSFMDLKNW